MPPKRKRSNSSSSTNIRSTKSRGNSSVNKKKEENQEKEQKIQEQTANHTNTTNNNSINKSSKTAKSYKNDNVNKLENDSEIKAVVNESNGEISCSIDETNRIRLLLGLKPLNSNVNNKNSNNLSLAARDGTSSSNNNDNNNDNNNNEINTSVTEDNNEISCSIEETNRIRAQLGLKPLNISSSYNNYKSKDEEAVVNFQNERNEADTIRHEELMRHKIEQARERRLDKQSLPSSSIIGNSSGEDLGNLSVADWVKRSRSIGATTAAAQQSKSQAQLQSQTNDNTGEEYLEGVRIKHDWQSLSSGSGVDGDTGVILTLADQHILKKDERGNMVDGGVMNPEEDVLQNVNVVEEERRQERKRMLRYSASVNQAGGYTGLDDHEFLPGYDDDNNDDSQDYRHDPRRDIGRGMLAHYDADEKSKEILKKNRMVIGKAGIIAGGNISSNSGSSAEDMNQNTSSTTTMNNNSNNASSGMFVDVVGGNSSRQLSSSDDFLRSDEVKKKSKSTFKKKKKKDKDIDEGAKRVVTGRVGDKMKEFEERDGEADIEADNGVSDAKEKLKQKLKAKAKSKGNHKMKDKDKERNTQVEEVNNQTSIDEVYEAQAEVKITPSMLEVDEEDDAENELLKSIARARRLHQSRENVMDVSTCNNNNSHNGISDTSNTNNSIDKYVLQRVKDCGTMNSINIGNGHNGNDNNKLVFSETTEFASRMRLQQKEKEMQKERTLVDQTKQHGSHTITSAIEDKSDSLMDVASEDAHVSRSSLHEDIDTKTEKNKTSVLKGPQAQGSLAAALAMFRNSGGNSNDYIASVSAASNKKATQIIGRANDLRKESSHGLAKKEEKEIKIEHRDEYGNLLSKKEAYRHLSYRFHGKGSLPGVKKQEKRRKEIRLQQEAQSNSHAGTGTGGTRDYDPLTLQTSDIPTTKSDTVVSINNNSSHSRGAAMMGYIKAAQQASGQAHVSFPGANASSGMHLQTNDSEIIKQMAIEKVKNKSSNAKNK